MVECVARLPCDRMRLDAVDVKMPRSNNENRSMSVSYTHLTLPTKLEV